MATEWTDSGWTLRARRFTKLPSIRTAWWRVSPAAAVLLLRPLPQRHHHHHLHHRMSLSRVCGDTTISSSLMPRYKRWLYPFLRILFAMRWNTRSFRDEMEQVKQMTGTGYTICSIYSISLAALLCWFEKGAQALYFSRGAAATQDLNDFLQVGSHGQNQVGHGQRPRRAAQRLLKGEAKKSAGRARRSY